MSTYSLAQSRIPRRPSAAVEPNAEAIMLRSWLSSDLATVQPLLISKMTFLAGTCTSVRNVSQNGDAPLMSLIGRVSTPAEAMSMRMKVMPACFLASGSVRTSRNIQSARLANEVQIFWPLMTYWSPCSTARVCREARSLPEPGSE